MTIKERILSWARRIDGDVIDRPAAKELSDEYLDKLQRKIDAEIRDGATFETVKRASW